VWYIGVLDILETVPLFNELQAETIAETGLGG
jgi:hypothetical protein